MAVNRIGGAFSPGGAQVIYDARYLQIANNLSDVANASTSRTNLGVAIGTNVQAWDANLDQIAALAPTDNNFIVGNGSAWALETPSDARTSIGLVAGGAGDIWVEKAGDTMTGQLSVNGQHIFPLTGEVVFNETAADLDFRVEGDTITNLLHIDAGLDTIGIGIAPVATQLVKISRTFTDFANGLYRMGLHPIVIANQTNASVNVSTGYVAGFEADTYIGATNTKNWTDTPGMAGAVSYLETTTGGTGTVTHAAHFTTFSDLVKNGAAVTNQYGLYLHALTSATNNYGIYINTPTGTIAEAIHVAGGNSLFDGRVLQNQGADVASATNLVLGADGNVFEITGTTKIDLISNLTWGEGAIITLIANESVVIDHGTAISGTNITIMLAGAVDYSMTANDTLTLILSSTTAGGQAWRECARTVI